MTARWYIADVNGDFTEITGRVPLEGWEIQEQAEEGSSGISTVTFDDPDMDYDPEPWRNWYVLEDTSEDANSMLCGGWQTEQEVGREGGEIQNPLGRTWSVALTDANTYWGMRVMVGADANRPAETDVERMQWLLATNEVAWALDVTTYVSTANPVSLDACDYRGRMLDEIVQDCSQPPANKNWYAWIDMLAGVRTVTIWYGRDSLAVRDSPLSLSNDPDDWKDAELEDGTSLVWPISYDTKLKRDPSRMYDGCYLTYEGGAVYRDTNPRTVRRDFISPNSLVKSSAKAIARAEGYLTELVEQNLVITTTVELPAAKATMIRAGMRLMFRATHLPGFDTAGTFAWCRVLSCSVTPVAAGERYRLTLELTPGTSVATGAVFASLQRAESYDGVLGFMHCSNDIAIGWWPYSQIQGPFEIVESSAPYLGIRALADMVVRITSVVEWSGVVGDFSITVDLKVDGDVIGSDTQTHTGGLGYWAPRWTIDVRDYSLTTGSVITVTADYAGGGWTNFGTNYTYVNVGRGTIDLGDGFTFVGP